MFTIACDTAFNVDEPRRELCKAAAAHAQRGCGLSYDHYVTLFQFGAIDALYNRLPDEQRAQARNRGPGMDYATLRRTAGTRDWNAEHGYCSHAGIEFGCCPAGCDRDDDDSTKAKA